jgi:hypothetical protein
VFVYSCEAAYVNGQDQTCRDTREATGRRAQSRGARADERLMRLTRGGKVVGRVWILAEAARTMRDDSACIELASRPARHTVGMRWAAERSSSA